MDGTFFKEKMGEDIDNQNSVTFSTDIQSVRADWIINEDQGLIFLKELLVQQNKEMFETPFIQIIVQFLYKQST